jgi:hypothetical protein
VVGGTSAGDRSVFAVRDLLVDLFAKTACKRDSSERQ